MTEFGENMEGFEGEKQAVERAIVSVEVMVDPSNERGMNVGIGERRILGLSGETAMGFVLIEGVGSNGWIEKYSKFLGEEKLAEGEYAVFGKTTEDVEAKRKELPTTGLDYNKMMYLFIKPSDETQGALRLVISVPGENRGELADLMRTFREAVETRTEGQHETFKEYGEK